MKENRSASEPTVNLYRPVGLRELELIADSDWRSFPPRLDWQPIFYPVLNLDYARQIANEWNTEDAFSGYCGIVTGFALKEAHFLRYKIENVGDVRHNELWVPAEELNMFNRNIQGGITIVDAFFGKAFDGVLPENIREKLKPFLS